MASHRHPPGSNPGIEMGQTPLTPSSYQKAKAYHKYRGKIWGTVRSVAFISLGVLSAGFGLEGFLLPNKFLDGGATGISLLTAFLTHWHLAPLLVIVNIPFLFLAYHQIGKWFCFRAGGAILALAVCITFIHYPVITSDKLLIAVFGGFFLGAGIGLTIRGGGVLDGTEILAIFLGRKTGATVGDIVLVLNILIFSLAAYVFSIETALYSILTYLAASRTMNYLIDGIEEYTGVTIISAKSEEIGKMIAEKLGRGITVYKGTRGYGKRGHLTDINIIFTVLTRLEISRLRTEVDQIDPHAFVVMQSIRDTKGGMIKKKVLN